MNGQFVENVTSFLSISTLEQINKNTPIFITFSLKKMKIHADFVGIRIQTKIIFLDEVN